MAPNFEIARFGSPVDLIEASDAMSKNAPRIVAGLGRGAQTSCANGYLSLWFVHRGHVQAIGSNLSHSLFEGQCFVNMETPLRLVSSGDSAWLGITMPMIVADQMLSESIVSPTAMQSGVDLYDDCTKVLVESILNSIESNSGVQQNDYQGIINSLFQLESKARGELKRCPGRTESSRRLSYQRLMRVKAHIAISPGHMDGINELAVLSNYSSCHFIRTFSRVFSESPLEYAHRLRLAHAKQLIRDGRLSVLEISREVGFVTFSAFCRSFRIDTGITPSTFRARQSA
jgi:AraC family transcriptional regulator